MYGLKTRQIAILPSTAQEIVEVARAYTLGAMPDDVAAAIADELRKKHIGHTGAAGVYGCYSGAPVDSIHDGNGVVIFCFADDVGAVMGAMLKVVDGIARQHFRRAPILMSDGTREDLRGWEPEHVTVTKHMGAHVAEWYAIGSAQAAIDALTARTQAAIDAVWVDLEVGDAHPREESERALLGLEAILEARKALIVTLPEVTP